MAAEIYVSINGLEVCEDGLRQLTGQATDYGTSEAADYLAMQLNNYVANAPYNYLSWAAGGPGPFSGFFSERQRRFVMASIKDGSIVIPYKRMEPNPYHVELPAVVSESVGMWYSMSDDAQTQMQGMRGWNKISVWLPAEERNIIEKFIDGVAKAIRDLFG